MSTRTPAGITGWVSNAAQWAVQEIEYRGGLACFRIPDGWIAEFGQTGGAAFYRDEPDSPTVRLDILTFASEPSATHRPASSFLTAKAAERNAQVVAMPSGNAVLSYDDISVRDGDRFRTRYWEVCQVLLSGHVRLAVFSFAASEERWDVEAVQTDLQTIAREIEDCVLAPWLGDI